MKKRIAFIFVALAVVLTACGAKAAATPYPDLRAPSIDVAPQLPASEAGAPATTAAYSDTNKSADSGTGGTPVQDRLVIMNADLTIVVKDPQARMDAISQMATTMAGSWSR